MEQETKILKDYSDTEKGAYISAIASIATADRSASAEETQFLEALSDAADLSPLQRGKVQHAATSTSEAELKQSLDILKGSELRFSLLTDLIAFAESDQHYTPEEKTNIEKIARYLGINQEQFSTINQFVQKTATTQVNHDNIQQQNFLGSLGMEKQFQQSGLNMGSLSKGLLGMAGPMILSKLLGKNAGGGGIGGMLGGLLGGGGSGLGGMSGGKGAAGAGSGGLGSLIGMLNGGRGIGSTGGLFGKLLKGGF